MVIVKCYAFTILSLCNISRLVGMILIIESLITKANMSMSLLWPWTLECMVASEGTTRFGTTRFGTRSSV